MVPSGPASVWRYYVASYRKTANSQNRQYG